MGEWGVGSGEWMGDRVDGWMGKRGGTFYIKKIIS
jgi:hypothetical protein